MESDRKPEPAAAMATDALSVAELRRLFDDAADRIRDDPDLQRVARAFWQQSGGRPATDDRAAIAEVKLQLERCGTQSEWSIVMRVAKNSYPYENPRSAAERLRRKLRKEISTK